MSVFEKIAIIGGTGLTQLNTDTPLVLKTLTVNTELGTPSASLQLGQWAQKDIIFLARHGNPAHIPPHRVNYRANILALKQAGAQAILAVNAVGGISANMRSGAIVIPDQIIDYTYGREHTFFDGQYQPLQHIDFSFPYDDKLRSVLIQAASDISLEVVVNAVYGATQGPRLETAAEIKRLEQDGCDLVGMTAMPEAVLARELGIPYASICLVVNPAAGKSDGLITMEEIHRVLSQGMHQVQALLAATLARL